VNIIEFLKQHNIQAKEKGQHHHTRDGWVQVDCPYCCIGGGWHMGLAIGRPVASCWRCGSRPIWETLKLLLGGHAANIRDLKYAHTRRVARTGTFKRPANVKPLTDLHRGYILKRGIDCDVVETFWHVSSIAWDGTRLAGRLYIPVLLQGDEVSYTTRAIHDNGLRYISAAEDEEAVSHKDLLYGEEHCAQTVLVVEGPLDVWSVGPGCCCTFGTAFTPAQLLRLSRYPRRVLCYDAEMEGTGAGDKAVASLAAALSVMPGTTEVVKLSTGKDPSAARYEEVLELRRFAFGSEQGCGRIRNLC
jgi:hypothetical protein